MSVLRQGDAFGEQAIINGCQPHGTAASPATNVTLLVVSKQVSVKEGAVDHRGVIVAVTIMMLQLEIMC